MVYLKIKVIKNIFAQFEMEGEKKFYLRNKDRKGSTR